MATQTDEERKQKRARRKELRNGRSKEERERLPKLQRQYDAATRARMTPGELERRREKDRISRKARGPPTDEQRELRRASKKAFRERHKGKETKEEKKERRKKENEKARKVYAAKREKETEEEKEARLVKQRAAQMPGKMDKDIAAISLANGAESLVHSRKY
ncbi:hypothetical protein OQA88_5952 [Cercophora sp. LCS_1]